MKRLYRDDSVLGIIALLFMRTMPNFYPAIVKESNNRWQQGASVFIVKHCTLAAAHSGNQRIGCTQINAYRQPVLVRCCA